jgi:chemotaxis protein methyltransferase CheR
VVPEYRWPVLRERLEQLGNGGGLRVALDRLAAGDAAARSAAFTASAIPETYMFRHPGHFALLAELAEERRRKGLPTTVLSAGCSTGEEVWSAAAVLSTKPLDYGMRHRVVGWDLCPDRIATAQSARYSDWSRRSGLRGLEHCFVNLDRGFTVAPELRELVSFQSVNLVNGPLPSELTFDVIFFRNVSIYWTEDTVHRTSLRLAQLLGPDGTLLVGPSDPVELPRVHWQQRMDHNVRSFWRVDDAASGSRPATERGPTRRVTSRGAAPTTRSTPPPRKPRPPRVTEAAPGAEEELRHAPDSSPIDRVRRLADRGLYHQALAVLETNDLGTGLDGKLWHGILLLATENNAAAIRAFRHCVFLEPHEVEYRRWLAVAYEAAGRKAESERERRNASELEKP